MKISVQDMSIVFKAFGFAARKHQNQRRKGRQGAPYINHPIDVAERLWEIGEIRDINTIIAGILHDIIEDTETSQEELETEFGSEICSIVLEVTDDKSLPQQVRKRLQVEHAGNLSFAARQVKLADKISNIQEVIDSPPINWSLQQRREYVAWGEEVINELLGSNENLERYFKDLSSKAKQKFEEVEKNQ